MHQSVRGHSRRRLITVAAALLLLAGMLWGITGAFATSSSPSPASGKVILRLGWTNDPDNLNPFIGYTATAYEVWGLNYDLLCGFRASDMSTPQGKDAVGLATAWTHTPDGLTWTFTIRSGVKWSDGTALTAKDVAFTFNYINDNKESMFTSYTKFITSVEAPNDTTAIFHCSKPKANMTQLWIPILPEHIWSKVPGDAAQTSYKMPMPIVGSGPFYTAEWKKGAYVRMERNPYYWRNKPVIDEVFFQTYQNADTMAAELKAGSIDGAVGLLDAEYRALQNDKSVMTLSYETIGFEELGFNCYTGKSLGNPVLKDYRFRQALHYAVNTNQINAVAYGGHAIPADTIINKGYYHTPDWHWNPPTPYTFDLEKAKAALDAAGYKDTNGDGIRDYQGKPISLRLYARSEDQATVSVGKLVAGSFRQVGLKITLTAMDDATLSNHIYNTEGKDFVPDYDMFFWDWGGDVDPNFILSVFTTDQINSWSDCAWSNKEYDQLFLQQQTTIDPTQRKAIIDRMQQIVYEQTPYILTVYGNDLEAVNTARWTGWVHSPANVGGVFYNTQPDSYIFLTHKTAAKSSTSHTLLFVIIGVLVAIAVVIIVLVILGRRGRALEEA